MQIQLAQRMDAMKASEIREILKLTRKPGVISFAGGLPAPEVFPVAEMQEVAGTMLASRGCEVLQYSTTEGEADLREWIAGRMNSRLGTSVEPSEILVTSGSQQGLDLTGEVLCESPTYLGAIQAFTAYRPRFVEVPTDDDGMLPEELEKRLAGCRRPKIIYVVPDFQNPTGRCWSLERRRQVRDVARGFPVVVVEDNPYGELRFEGIARPPLKALDRHGQVVMLGTFSKILCPGLRLGWIAAPVELLEKYVLVKQGADLHTSTLCQRLAADYVRGTTWTPRSPASGRSTGAAGTSWWRRWSASFRPGCASRGPRAGFSCGWSCRSTSRDGTSWCTAWSTTWRSCRAARSFRTAGTRTPCGSTSPTCPSPASRRASAASPAPSASCSPKRQSPPPPSLVGRVRELLTVNREL
jgi:2-aminoadipate transaminase